MGRSYAQVKVSIWSDGDFRNLSPEAQHLYFALLTNPTMNVAGVADWRPRRFATLACGWTDKLIRKAASELEVARYIITDDNTEEVAVRTFIRHDNVLRSFKSAKGMTTCWERTYSPRIRAAITTECHRAVSDDAPSQLVLEIIAGVLDYPCDTPSDTPSEAPCDAPSDGLDVYLQPPSNDPPHPPTTYNPSPRTVPGAIEAAFETFWDLYPRKVGKVKAHAAFIKASRTIDPETIVNGVARLANDPNLPEKQFVPHATTWLNEGRWEDEPYPEDTSNLSRQDRVLRSEYAHLSNDPFDTLLQIEASR